MSILKPIGTLVRGLLPKESRRWNMLRSPALRYRLFRDPTDTLLFALSVGRPSVFFVQVGSNDASFGDPLQTFLGHRHWRGIMIEPVEYVFKRLSARFAGNDRFILEKVAIAEIDGSKDFYYLQESTEGENLPAWYDQLGSFSLPTILKHRQEIPDIDSRVRTTSCTCMTFRSLCDKHGVKKIDLIHIDTEGFDYEVLKLIDLEHHRPTLVMYEHKHLSEGDRKAARTLLADRGYLLAGNSADTLAASSSAIEAEPLLRSAWSIVTKTLGAS